MIETRKIQQDEVKAHRQIGGYSYGNWSDEIDEWIPEPDHLDNMLGLFVDGQIVAGLVNRRYEQMVRGVWQSASAIGGVATWPEYRRQGHVRRLMDATFADMQEKAQTVSALYPFNQSFYAKFGYVRTNPIPRVRLACSALSHLLSLTREAGETWRYERVRAVDSVEAYKQFVDQVAKERGHKDYNGYMRDPQFAADDCRDQHVVFVREKEGHQTERVVAAARYVLKGYGSDGTNMIHDCHWVDARARDRLLAFFALHGAGMPHIRLHVPPQVNFHSWLSDSDTAYAVQMSHLPLMVRVMDVAQAISGIRVEYPVASESPISFQVNDSICPWVGGTFEIAETNGVLASQRVDGHSTIAMTIEGITALVYGTLSLDEIENKGWISGLGNKEYLLFDHWFPAQPVFNLLEF